MKHLTDTHLGTTFIPLSCLFSGQRTLQQGPNIKETQTDITRMIQTFESEKGRYLSTSTGENFQGFLKGTKTLDSKKEKWEVRDTGKFNEDQTPEHESKLLCGTFTFHSE